MGEHHVVGRPQVNAQLLRVVDEFVGEAEVNEHLYILVLYPRGKAVLGAVVFAE